MRESSGNAFAATHGPKRLQAACHDTWLATLLGTYLAQIARAGRNRKSTTPERRRIGREARDAPTSGWLDSARRVKDDVTADNVSMIAAGGAFFGPPRALPHAS